MNFQTLDKKERNLIAVKKYQLKNLKKVRDYNKNYKSTKLTTEQKEKYSKDARDKFNKLYREDEEFKKKHLLRKADRETMKKEFCSKCGTKDKLQIHHTKYDKTSPRIVFCRPCHTKEHSK